MQSASVEPPLGTILLIDDDLELSDAMSEFLKIHGYATLQAQNEQTAIDLLKTMATVPSFSICRCLCASPPETTTTGSRSSDMSAISRLSLAFSSAAAGVVRSASS